MREYLQTGCLALGILCFLYYIGIVLYAGIRTSLSWLWIVAGIYFLALGRLLSLREICPGVWPRVALYVMLTLLALGLAVIMVLGSRVISGMRAVPEENLDYVIVLGAQVNGTEPSLALRRRLDRAVEYAGENPGTTLILSGGQGLDEEISEAECMRRYLARAGVEKDRIRLEDRSVSTSENLRFSARFLDASKDRVGVLTNNFHVYRALALAQSAGYRNVCGIPADAAPGMQPHNILREVCCLLVEMLRGRIR